jgi:hypothetical protein
MTDSNAEILSTELTIHFGATLAVTTTASGFSDWIRPAASFSTKWKGSPSGAQIVLAAEHTQNNILAPLLEEIIGLAQQRLTEVRRGA